MLVDMFVFLLTAFVDQMVTLESHSDLRICSVDGGACFLFFDGLFAEDTVVTLLRHNQQTRPIRHSASRAQRIETVVISIIRNRFPFAIDIRCLTIFLDLRAVELPKTFGEAESDWLHSLVTERADTVTIHEIKCPKVLLHHDPLAIRFALRIVADALDIHSVIKAPIVRTS